MGDNGKKGEKPKGRFMTQGEVSEELGIDRRKIIRWSKSGENRFPRPVKVVARTYLFSRREIETWELDRAWAEERAARMAEERSPRSDPR